MRHKRRWRGSRHAAAWFAGFAVGSSSDTSFADRIVVLVTHHADETAPVATCCTPHTAPHPILVRWSESERSPSRWLEWWVLRS